MNAMICIPCRGEARYMLFLIHNCLPYIYIYIYIYTHCHKLGQLTLTFLDISILSCRQSNKICVKLTILNYNILMCIAILYCFKGKNINFTLTITI